MCTLGNFVSDGFVCITNACHKFPKDRAKALIQWDKLCEDYQRNGPYVVTVFSNTNVILTFDIYIAHELIPHRRIQIQRLFTFKYFALSQLTEYNSMIMSLELNVEI